MVSREGLRGFSFLFYSFKHTCVLPVGTLSMIEFEENDFVTSDCVDQAIRFHIEGSFTVGILEGFSNAGILKNLSNLLFQLVSLKGIKVFHALLERPARRYFYHPRNLSKKFSGL